MASLSRNSDKRILIVGAGALGTLFAARLSSAGVAVTVLDAWQAAVDALNKNGAILVKDEGSPPLSFGHLVKKLLRIPPRGGESAPINAITKRPRNSSDDSARSSFSRRSGLTNREIDSLRLRSGQASEVRPPRKIKLALVLVKSWQTADVAQQLKDCLAPDGLAVTLQNGLGNAEVLASILGAERVVQGVTTTGAALIAPGIVRAGGEGLVSLEAHPRLGALTALLTEAGFQSEVVPSAASLVWGKLVINTAINPLSALLNIPNGELLKRPSARKLMGALAHETASVAAAQNIPLDFDEPVQIVEAVARSTASNVSSMLQDLRRGAPTEIDAICGAVVRVGAKHGVPTPLNETMTQLVKARVEGETW